MSKKICRSHSEYEEVAHYAIAQFMEHERGQELVDNSKGMQFLSGIIHRSFHSSTSQYHTLYRQKGRVHTLHERHTNVEDDEEYDYSKDTATEAICGVLEDMKADSIELWFRATLFEMYMTTSNYSELARATGIPRTSISKAVEEAREHVQTQLKQANIHYHD
jgi:DNA-directed RNA polymerase specialized sigma24 family protein